MTFKSISDYVKKHEVFLLVILAAVLITGGYSRLLGFLTHRDELAVQQSQSALQAQQRENARLAADNAQTVKSYQDLVKQLDGQYHQLLSAQTKRDTETKTQQAKDLTLSPPETATRWAELVKLPTAEIQPTESGYAVSPGVAKETIFELDSIPGLTEDLKDEQQIVVLKDQQIASQDNVNASYSALLNGKDDEIAKGNKACSDEEALIKQQVRKSKWHWFIFGAVAVEAAKIFLTHTP